jgi:cellulose biosynthesis protein BcsQ
LSLQTQGSSLRATKKLIPEIRQLVASLDIDLNILGVVAVIHSKSSATDKRIMKEASDLFEDAMFRHVIQHRERIKAWGEGGITDRPHDHWDREALDQYKVFGEEIIERIKKSEE